VARGRWRGKKCNVFEQLACASSFLRGTCQLGQWEGKKGPKVLNWSLELRDKRFVLFYRKV